MKKILAFLLLFLTIFNTTAFATDKNIDAITAPTYLLADGINNTYLLEENCTTNLAVNNFAKIMTAILVIEKLNADEIIPFTDETNTFFNNGFGNIAMTKPEMAFTVREHLCNMILLYSDSSARALAIAHSGSEEEFVKAMNKKASQLSMKDTVFTSSDGHDETGSAKTTVYDLYTLMRHAMNLPLFKTISKTVEFSLPSGTDGASVQYTSRNHLLSKYTYHEYVYSTATAGFISYSEGGSSFIAVCESPSRTLYSLVMNTPDNGTQVYKDVINLSEHGFNSYQSVILAKKGAYLHQVPLKSALSADTMLITDRDVSALLPIGYEQNDITMSANTPEFLKAPLEKNEVCGTATFYYKGKPLVTCSLVTEKDVKFFPLGGILRIFSKVNTWLILLIIIIIAIIVYFQAKHAKRKEELKKKKKAIMQGFEEKK